MATVTFTLDLADLHLPQVLSALGLLYYGEPTMPIVVTPEQPQPEQPKSEQPQPQPQPQKQGYIRVSAGSEARPIKNGTGTDATQIGWILDTDGWVHVERTEAHAMKGSMDYVTVRGVSGFVKRANVEYEER